MPHSTDWEELRQTGVSGRQQFSTNTLVTLKEEEIRGHVRHSEERKVLDVVSSAQNFGYRGHLDRELGPSEAEGKRFPFFAPLPLSPLPSAPYPSGAEFPRGEDQFLLSSKGRTSDNTGVSPAS